MEKNQITFIDHIGRLIIGQLANSTATTISVRNPAIIHMQPTPDGRMNIQTIPLFFRDFVAEANRGEGTIWEFNRNQLVLGTSVQIDARLLAQYDAVFAAPAAPAPVKQPDVIKLFE